MRKRSFLLLFGPNVLEQLEKDTLGRETVHSMNLRIRDKAKDLNVTVDVFQSNWEGGIIDKIHEAGKTYDGVVINTGAFTHYSIAIRDAIRCVRIPFIEAHTENLFSSESFRNESVISPVCIGQISGLGVNSYLLALEALRYSV